MSYDRRSVRERQEVWEKGQAPKTFFSYKLTTIRCRCANKNNPTYGGKGIKCNLTIDDLIYLWRRDRAWELKHPTIDRIDVNKHYDRENCRYIEMLENINRNPRTHSRKFYQINQEGKIVKIWNTISACSKSGFRMSSVIKALKGDYLYAEGFYWKYLE